MNDIVKAPSSGVCPVCGKPARLSGLASGPTGTLSATCGHWFPAEQWLAQFKKQRAANESQDPFAGAPVIYAYTRKDALADGGQVDVSAVAREAGLKFPVFLTRAVWERYVRVPEGVRAQDEQGRLFDIVWMLRCAARRTSGPEMRFRLRVRNDNRDRTPPIVVLKAVCGPLDIDDPQPAITAMLPEED
jgi:hypothetical protein